MQRASLLGLLLVTSGCAAAPIAREAVPPRDDTAARLVFQGIEDEVLRGLASLDRRVALRGHIDPTERDLRRVAMGAVLAEDASLGTINGAIDPFSFEARARGLAEVRQRLASAPTDLPISLSSPASERELLARLIDEELVRLEEERALPRSASALVRGVVETWSPPTSPQEAAERDRWLARRLATIHAAVTSPTTSEAASAPLDVVRARELDDALDALERASEAAGLGHATTELVRLREALETQGTRPAAGAVSDWTSVGRGLRAHLGLSVSPEVLDARLAASQTALHAAAERAIAATSGGLDAIVARAAPLVFASTACAFVVPESRVRSMTPPPERTAACLLGRSVTTAGDPIAHAAALVAMHDHVVVARWALEVARGHLTIAQASGRHRPLSRPGPDVAARWERLALARPTVAIGGGLAADILFGGGEVEERARAWALVGEVPLDIAERALARR